MENLNPEMRDLPNLGYFSSEDQMEVILHCIVSDFPVLQPAFWVGIFQDAFHPLSSSLPCSTIASLRLRLGIPAFPGSALGSHRLSLPFVFQMFWLGVPLTFQGFTPGSCGLCWLRPLNPGSVFGSHGLWLVVQWRLGILPVVTLTASPLLSTGIRITE